MIKLIVVWTMISAITPIAHAVAFEDAMMAFEAREYQRALVLWQTLAEQGDVDSQLSIGEMYAKGLGVTRDVKLAIVWFKKAAVQGSARAEYNLGVLYGNGQGIPVDYKNSVKWYRKAAERGHAAAQYSLGVKYFKGQGVPIDYPIAYAWMDVSANQGLKSSSIYRDLIASVLKPDELRKAKALAVQLLEKYSQDK